MLGVTWGPDHASHCHSHRFTAPAQDLRGAKEEVLRLRFCHLYNDGQSHWPRTDTHWLVFSDVKTLINLLVVLISGKRETNRSRRASSNSASVGRSGEPSSHVTETPPRLSVSLQATEPWQIFLFHSMNLDHLKSLLMLSVRLPACLPSYKHSLLVHFSEAIIEWTLRQG